MTTLFTLCAIFASPWAWLIPVAVGGFWGAVRRI